MTAPVQTAPSSRTLERIARETAPPRRILIVAGGTGGHIAPALATGAFLRKTWGERVVVRYLSGSRAIERRAFEAAEEFPERLSCDTPPSLSVAGLAGLARFAASIVEAHRLLRRFRPDAVLAMGGYVCAPALWAARLNRIPFYLHESNSVPGRATRHFARHAARVFVAYESAARRLAGSASVSRVGTPVRTEITACDRLLARTRLNLSPDAPTILVLGGSQGARGLNEALLGALPELARTPGVVPQVIWACGPLNHKSVAEQLARLEVCPPNVRLFPFIEEMGDAYAAADLIVSRAGASTLAEITLIGLPSILVPYPHAMDNHQEENARDLAAAGACEVIGESKLSGATLAAAIRGVLASPQRLAAMSAGARSVSAPDAALRIAQALMASPPPEQQDATEEPEAIDPQPARLSA